jgi:hypothetical protein
MIVGTGAAAIINLRELHRRDIVVQTEWSLQDSTAGMPISWLAAGSRIRCSRGQVDVLGVMDRRISLQALPSMIGAHLPVCTRHLQRGQREGCAGAAVRRNPFSAKCMRQNARSKRGSRRGVVGGNQRRMPGSSKLVGCSTGRSADLAPGKILTTSRPCGG